jgi:Pyruvate/2-oxoacid:ferredoxin oxidoreductase gamma subunit
MDNNDVAQQNRILGNIEANLSAIKKASDEHREGLQRLEDKVSARLDSHDERIRAIEVANPVKLGETLKKHDERLTQLEKNSARAGALAGLGGSVLIAAIVEYVKRKI